MNAHDQHGAQSHCCIQHAKSYVAAVSEPNFAGVHSPAVTPGITKDLNAAASYDIIKATLLR